MNQTPQISVLSYNIHKGFRAGGKRFVLHEIRKLLQETGVDLLFLQEVVGAHERHSKRFADWPEISQDAFLAEDVWTERLYGRNANHQYGHHGNAILSRFPLIRSENIDISTNRREQRGLLHAEMKFGEHGIIHLCCTHLDLTKRGRDKQLQRLCELIAERVPENAPLILAGDFNDWTKKLSRPLEKKLHLKEAVELTHGKLRATFPSSLPLLPLDRVYVRGLQVKDAKVLKGRDWKKLSDHVPVKAVLGFEESAHEA